MQPIAHPDPLYQDVDDFRKQQHSGSRGSSPFPLHWYIFFGILEPISVLAGVVYAIYFQENYYAELIPTGYLDKVASSSVTKAAAKGARSFWKVATQESTGFDAADGQASIAKLTEPAKMALAQLGSCYFLIFLNSALMLFFIKRHFSHSPASQERVLYAFFFVLGAADWTHILLTIHYLPSATSASASYPAAFASKIITLTDYKAWNSLLFGNIFITLVLFTFRAAWWVGIGRDTFVQNSNVLGNDKLKAQ